MSALFVSETGLASDIAPIPVHVCRPDDWADIKKGLTTAQQTFADARGFAGEAGQRVQLPDETGKISTVIFGAGSADGDVTGGIRAGALSRSLPDKHYRFASLPGDWDADLAAIGWGLGAYRFEDYLGSNRAAPKLVLDADQNIDEISSLVDATTFGRDLINTPSNDMGPVALEKAATDLAKRYGADVTSIVGEDLLKENYPMIHAVGRAAHEAPRLVQFEWGNPDHPRLAIIGKGITFDTGGVNIKSASSARLMKKDMGGAAHALAFAQMIMANDLPIRLHVLVSIAENAVSAGAYRPGDVLDSRSGQTVEIDNTDAEGRLVMGDALTRASEDEPVLIMDFATLTGAARVALGPKLVPYFSNRRAPVEQIVEHGNRVSDPVWPMPLWQPYMSMLKSPIADMKNSGGGFAGCITAGLFLERFVGGRPWMHFDVYGWNPAAAPGHPAGGEIFALRGLYAWLKSGGLNGDFSE